MVAYVHHARGQEKMCLPREAGARIAILFQSGSLHRIGFMPNARALLKGPCALFC